MNICVPLENNDHFKESLPLSLSLSVDSFRQRVSTQFSVHKVEYRREREMYVHKRMNSTILSNEENVKESEHREPSFAYFVGKLRVENHVRFFLLLQLKFSGTFSVLC